MTDVFDEVDEELRLARYQSWFQRGWPYAVAALAAALAIALGIWGWQAYGRSQDTKASEGYAHALEALLKNDRAGAETGFTTVSGEGSRAYRALALMQLGGLKLSANDVAGATALLDRAAKSAPSPIIGDAAAFQAALANLDAAPLAQTLARLQPLTAVGRPYRQLAREAGAMAKLANGRLADARSDLTILTLEQDVSDTAQARAHAAISMIDSGAASIIGPTVRAELALPHVPTPPPALLAGPGAQ